MLTYQLQSRHLLLENDVPPVFPGRLKLEFKLGPPEAFGATQAPSRLLVLRRPMKGIWDANTGRNKVLSEPPLEPLSLSIDFADATFCLKGDVFNFDTACKNPMDLQSCIMAFQYVFPALLNTGFADPPTFVNARGQIGETVFRWELADSTYCLWVASKDNLEKHIEKSLDRLQLLQGTKNRRVAAALRYCHTASRLIVAGYSEWEFMAESVLNWCKALQVLFGETREQVRNGLKKLAYTDPEIEGDFMPIMILRSKYDVGHARTTVLEQKQLQTVYEYLAQTERHFRELFDRIFDRLTQDKFELPQDDLALDAKERRDFDKLVQTMQQRIPPPKVVQCMPIKRP